MSKRPLEEEVTGSPKRGRSEWRKVRVFCPLRGGGESLCVGGVRPGENTTIDATGGPVVRGLERFVSRRLIGRCNRVGAGTDTVREGIRRGPV
jgi:hypothetical protein